MLKWLRIEFQLQVSQEYLKQLGGHWMPCSISTSASIAAVFDEIYASCGFLVHVLDAPLEVPVYT